MVDALIMAAGSGERMPGARPKQYTEIAGRPMLAWSVARFAATERVTTITLVVAPGEEGAAGDVLGEAASKVTRVVAGGETRQDSVRLGLEALDEASEIVLIHDAARPCVTERLIDAVIEALAESETVVPALPVTDTLVLDREGSVDAIIDRAGVAGVQTPQGFRSGVIRSAHRRAHAEGLRSSDDGSLVYAYGGTVRTIAGERTNIKVTFGDDLRIAEVILANQS